MVLCSGGSLPHVDGQSHLADLWLIDEGDGYGAATRWGLRCMRTVGLLEYAGQQGLLDVLEAMAREDQGSASLPFRFPCACASCGKVFASCRWSVGLVPPHLPVMHGVLYGALV